MVAPAAAWRGAGLAAPSVLGMGCWGLGLWGEPGESGGGEMMRLGCGRVAGRVAVVVAAVARGSGGG